MTILYYMQEASYDDSTRINGLANGLSQVNKSKTFIFETDNINFDVNCYFDKENNIWFRGKEIAKILQYVDTDKAIRKYVIQKIRN